jgi:hypothetical protein
MTLLARVAEFLCLVTAAAAFAAEPPQSAVIPITDPITGRVLHRPYGIQVVDATTGRGVPLVTLRTTNEQVFVTDSAGWAAIDAPDLLGQKVFFHVASHGYEYPQDGFGFRGKALPVIPGDTAKLEINRLNIAERLYRVTGGGLYADSVRIVEAALLDPKGPITGGASELPRTPLETVVPIQEPLLSGRVSGQDSVQAVVFQDRIHWFWGDTNQLAYPLGHFGTATATSQLPGRGGLTPSVGVDLTYSVDERGFSRPAFRFDEPGVVWLDGVTVLTDANTNQPTIVGHFSRREGLAKQLEHGICRFEPGDSRMTAQSIFPDDARLYAQGQAFQAPGDDGQDYVYFATPYPCIRVRARPGFYFDHTQYQAFTPLQAGSGLNESDPALERDANGRVVWGWKRDTAALTAAAEHKLIQAGHLQPHEARWQTTAAATGDRVLLHGGSVRWNAFRNRWVLIAVQTYGKPSFLGEVWYAESERIEGPWTTAVRIVTHDKYSFYNPTQHDFFDEDGGRVIYFEGTYTHTFSGNPVPTPRYDYNQIMYRLDLGDPRLRAAAVSR